MKDPGVEAAVLAKILLVQSVVGQFTRDEDIRGFVGRGLEELPGVFLARWLPPGSAFPPASDGPARRTFPLRASGSHHGYFELTLGDADLFEPCAPHITNLCFMVAVALEERHQRRLNEEHQRTLESRVQERTQQLQQEVAERLNAQTRADAERRRAERYLEVTEAFVVELDTEGRVELLNERGCALLGRRSEAAIGHHWLELAVPAEEHEAAKALFLRVLQEDPQTVHRHEGHLVTAAGAERLVAWRCAVRREGDRVVGTLCSGIDITERRKLLELSQQTQRLQSLGVLAGGIAHDFNNLLHGTFANIELAKDACPAGSEVAECLEEALVVCERAKALTQQLLTFSKGGSPVLEAGAITQVLEESVRFALSGSAVSVTFAANALWDCEFDHGQIARVFDNLAINAKQAMGGQGRLCVRAENVDANSSIHPDLEAGRYVRVSFSDTGPGIAADHLPHIFDPFFTTKGTGSGLGLAASHSIVRGHHGALTVESRPGEGATFHIWLRAASGKPRQAATPVPISYQGRGVVLVMDDEDFIRQALRKMLSKLGYEVIETADGQGASAVCQREREAGRRIDAMILDLTVRGGLGGRDVAQSLREFYPDTPLFAASGYNADPVMSHPEAYGFAAGLPKPFSLRQLSRLLQQHVSSSKS